MTYCGLSLIIAPQQTLARGDGHGKQLCNNATETKQHVQVSYREARTPTASHSRSLANNQSLELIAFIVGSIILEGSGENIVCILTIRIMQHLHCSQLQRYLHTIHFSFGSVLPKLHKARKVLAQKMGWCCRTLSNHITSTPWALALGCQN